MKCEFNYTLYRDYVEKVINTPFNPVDVVNAYGIKEVIKEYDLPATTQKSYYHKAKVIETAEGVYLQSYNTIVCGITPNNEFIKLWDGWSVTTAKHINDFLRLFNMDTMNKAAWMTL